MKAQKSEKYDYITALASARKFHDVGKKYLGQWGKTGHLSPTDAFVSATNYGLALELYLKSLLIMEGSTEIKGHHLDSLFEKLSDETKQEIINAYQNVGGLERKEVFYIRGRLTGSNVDEAANTPARGTKLNQLLENNKDIFVIFRYMFEKARTQNWEYFFFEYENLDVAISALSSVADQILTPEEKQKVSML